MIGSPRWRGGVYLGTGRRGRVFAPEESATLVLGPPRSGKSSCVVIPNVLAAPGAVVSTSTKREIMDATASRRAILGPTAIFDPTGETEPAPGVQRVCWSPVHGAASWERALLMAHSMVGASAARSTIAEAGDHWHERAEALIAVLLHASALSGGGIRRVLGWVHRQELADAAAALERAGAEVSADMLQGIAATAERERSGIFSTAAGTLRAYRSEPALASAEGGRSEATPASGEGRRFDPDAFVAGRGTLYLCAPAHRQALVAPLVVGLIEDIRSAAYARAQSLERAARVGEEPPEPPGALPARVGRAHRDHRPPSRARGPGAGAQRAMASPPAVLLALDEVANIAPLPGLPSLVAEGGGQGLLTLACLQDLSQARGRWGEAARGFLTLFGSKLILPGIADLGTLELVSALGGDEDVAVRSRSRSRSRRGAARSASVTTRRQRRLAPDSISRGVPGGALWLQGGAPPATVMLTPWFGDDLWRPVGRGPASRDAARTPAPSEHRPRGAPEAHARHRGILGGS